MVQQLFSRVLNTKTLIRVAFTALSLAGMAHAQSTNGADRTPAGGTRPAPAQQRLDFMEGGGG
jgi:hypothetical protein